MSTFAVHVVTNDNTDQHIPCETLSVAYDVAVRSSRLRNCINASVWVANKRIRTFAGGVENTSVAEAERQQSIVRLKPKSAEKPAKPVKAEPCPIDKVGGALTERERASANRAPSGAERRKRARREDAARDRADLGIVVSPRAAIIVKVYRDGLQWPSSTPFNSGRAAHRFAIEESRSRRVTHVAIVCDGILLARYEDGHPL